MYRWVEHTADLALELRAAGPLELLVEGLDALVGTWVRPAAMAALTSRDGSLDVDEVTLEEIFVNVLNEQIFIASVRGQFIDPEQVAARGRLVAWDGGWRLRVPPGPLYRELPSAEPVGDHLKAATHHGLAIRSGDGGWTATVVIDV